MSDDYELDPDSLERLERLERLFDVEMRSQVRELAFDILHEGTAYEFKRIQFEDLGEQHKARLLNMSERLFTVRAALAQSGRGQSHWQALTTLERLEHFYFPKQSVEQPAVAGLLIALYDHILPRTRQDDPGAPHLLFDYARASHDLYTAVGDPAQLDRSIDALSTGRELLHAGVLHITEALSVSYDAALACSLRTRYVRTRYEGDLRASTEHLRHALDWTTRDDQRALLAGEYGTTLYLIATSSGDPALLDNAIAALDVPINGHFLPPTIRLEYTLRCANVSLEKFSLTDAPADADRATQRSFRALQHMAESGSVRFHSQARLQVAELVDQLRLAHWRTGNAELADLLVTIPQSIRVLGLEPLPQRLPEHDPDIPARNVNVWASSRRLFVEESFRLEIGIGDTIPDSILSVELNEPKLGPSSTVELTVILIIDSEDAAVSPAWAEIELPADGPSTTATFWIEPLRPGLLKGRVEIRTSREAVFLQELAIEIGTVHLTEDGKVAV